MASTYMKLGDTTHPLTPRNWAVAGVGTETRGKTLKKAWDCFSSFQKLEVFFFLNRGGGKNSDHARGEWQSRAPRLGWCRGQVVWDNEAKVTCSENQESGSGGKSQNGRSERRGRVAVKRTAMGPRGSRGEASRWVALPTPHPAACGVFR